MKTLQALKLMPKTHDDIFVMLNFHDLEWLWTCKSTQKKVFLFGFCVSRPLWPTEGLLSTCVHKNVIRSDP